MKLFRWFVSRPEKHVAVLGVCIAHTTARWVRLIQDPDTRLIRVQGHGSIALAPDSVVDGSIQKPNDLLRSMLPLRMYAASPIACAVPIEAMHMVKLSVPLEEGADPETNIQDEITSYIMRTTSLIASDTICEYEIIHSTPTHAYIFCTLYPRSQVEAYKAIFQRVGYTSVETMSIPASLARVHSDDPRHAYIMIDMGVTVTHVALVTGTTISQLESIPVGESTLVNAIATYLDISIGEATKIYKRYGLMHTHREPALLSHLYATLHPLKQSIENILSVWQDGAYKHYTENIPITEIVLLGEGAYGKGVLDYVRRTSRLEARHLNVWRLFPEVHNVVPEIDWHDALSFAPAIAVALEKMRKSR